MMLWMRGFSDCWETASSASSRGSAGLHQRRELAGEQRQVGGRYAPAQGEAPVALGLAVSDLGDGDRQELPVAQDLPHVFDGVAFDHAILFAARGVESGVFEGTHRWRRINPRA